MSNRSDVDGMRLADESKQREKIDKEIEDIRFRQMGRILKVDETIRRSQDKYNQIETIAATQCVATCLSLWLANDMDSAQLSYLMTKREMLGG